MLKRDTGLINGLRDPWLTAVSPDTTVGHVYRQKPAVNNPGVPQIKCISPARSPDTTYKEGDHEPWLEVIDQPVESVRFRYLSELQGTPHGPLFARSCCQSDKGSRVKKKKKTYPTVKLHNCEREAKVRCWLVTGPERPELHVHDLVTRKNTNKKDIQYEPHVRALTRKNNYTASFDNMVVLHSVSKNMQMFRKKKFLWDHRFQHLTHIDESLLEDMNFKDVKDKYDMNVVYLYFEAYVEHRNTIEVLCSVASEPVRNLKNPEAGELKIVRCSSKKVGSPAGGDELFVFCSKLPKDIRIEFFCEENNWVEPAYFGQDPSDVHCQCAIVFRTPPCPFAQEEDKKVFFRLVRTSDLVFSNACEYTYSPRAADFGSSPLPISKWSGQPVVKTKKRKLDTYEDIKPSGMDLHENMDCTREVIIDDILNADLPSDDPPFNSSDKEALLVRLGGDDLGEMLDDDEGGLLLEPMIEANWGEQLVMEGPSPIFPESGLVAADGPSRRSLQAPQVPAQPKRKGLFLGQFGCNLGSFNYMLLLLAVSLLYTDLPLSNYLGIFLIGISTRGIIKRVMKYLPLLYGWTIRQVSEESGQNKRQSIKQSDLFQLIKANDMQRFQDWIRLTDTRQMLQRSENGRTLFHEAVVGEKADFITAILPKASLCLEATDAYGDTVFHSASKLESNHVLQILLRSCSHSQIKKLISQANFGGLNCLHLAAIHGRSCMVGPLVTAGLDIDSGDEFSGKTALMFAASYAHDVFVKTIIEHGADVNAVNWAGNTVMDICTFTGNKKTAEYLIKIKAQHGTLLDQDDQNDFYDYECSTDEEDIQEINKNDGVKTLALFSMDEVERLGAALEGDDWKRVAASIGEEHLVSSFLHSPHPAKMLISYIELHKDELLGRNKEEQLRKLMSVFESLSMNDARDICKRKVLR